MLWPKEMLESSTTILGRQYKEGEMKIEEIQKMGNEELIYKLSGLITIREMNYRICKSPDDDLYMDIELIKDEILVRMSRGGVIDYTNNLN